MDNMNLFTVTFGKGLRATRGATFRLQRLEDGRHFLKPKAGESDGLQIDVSLLLSRDALVNTVTKHAASANGAGVYTQTEVTLLRAGLGLGFDRRRVLVPAKDDEHIVPAQTGASASALVWFPESDMIPGNPLVDRYEDWLMPGLVRLLRMHPLWILLSRSAPDSGK